MELQTNKNEQNTNSQQNQDLQNLEGFGLQQLKDLIKQQISDQQNDLEQKLTVEYNKKINLVNNQCSKLMQIFAPLQELIMITTDGKSMPEAITDHVMENGVIQRMENFIQELVSKEDFNQVKDSYVKKEFFEEIRENLMKGIEGVQNRLSEIDNSRQQVDSNLKNIQSMFTEKVDLSDLSKIEARLADCAPWDAVRNVYKEINLYLRKDDFSIHKAELQKTFKDIQDLLNLLVSKKDVQNELLNLKLQIMKEFEKYSKIKDCQSYRQDIQRSMGMLNNINNDHKKSFNRIDNDIVNLKRQIQNKAEDYDLNALKKQTEEYALKNDFNKLEHKVLPTIQQFERKILEFQISASQHSEIIRRYDEVISEKASKFMVTQIQTEANRTFAKNEQIQGFEEKVEQMKRFVEELSKNNEEKFEAINQQFSNEIINAIKKVLKQQQHNQNSTTHQIGDISEVYQVLNSKANRSDLERLNEQKSNKVDTEQLLNSLGVLSRQLKHMLVLFMESIRSSLANASDTVLLKENKKKFLLRQLKALAKWVMKFDPLSQTSTCLGEEQNFLQNEEGRALQEFTDQVLSDVISLQNFSLSVPPNFNVQYNRSRAKKSNLSMTQQVFNVRSIIFQYCIGYSHQ
uniref:Putative reticulocyte-binding protein 2 n=1 Tax=Kahliella matisi TaxID=479472 RepID=B8X447_9STIC|nr:putative reticulocyte-binding protein 2 [Kahliella matisi]